MFIIVLWGFSFTRVHLNLFGLQPHKCGADIVYKSTYFSWLREVGPDSRYLSQYRDQAKAGDMRNLLFNSCHGTKYISSPKRPYRLWDSLNLLCSGIHGSFGDRGLHLPTRRHLLDLRMRRCGTDPPLPPTFLYGIQKDNFAFILSLRSIKFESDRKHWLC